jgi:hypothetical protein
LTASRDPRTPAPLPIRAVYTLPEFAAAVPMSRQRALRLLRRLGVVLIRSGRIWLVPLDELEKKASSLWNSVRAAELERHLS